MTIVAIEPALTSAEQEQVLDLSNERDYWLRRVLAAWRRGYAAGYAAGRADELAGLEAAHRAMARAILGRPAHAELEARRWGPGGRARFADPRRCDYHGGPVSWDQERERGAA